MWRSTTAWTPWPVGRQTILRDRYSIWGIRAHRVTLTTPLYFPTALGEVELILAVYLSCPDRILTDCDGPPSTYGLPITEMQGIDR